MLELAVKILASYLIGSLNGSLVLAKLVGGPDIRSQGSGSAGGTNALRTRGLWFALAVVVVDVGKGFLTSSILPAARFPGVPIDPDISRTWLMLGCAAATILGHCYPVWFEFSGGKGAATAIGALLAVAPDLVLPGSAVWILVLTTTGYVGLATMVAAGALPVWLTVSGIAGRYEVLFFLIILAGFILFTHRANIRRMLRGEENRMVAAMLLRRSN